MMNNELTYWVAFATMQGISQARRMHLFCNAYEATQSAEKAIITLLDDSEIQRQVGVTTEEQAVFDFVKEQLASVAFFTESLLKQGYGIIPITSDKYCQLIKHNLQRNAPLVLFTKGNTSLLNEPSIAIVGSRNANSVSLQFTESVARKACSEGKVIISGGAKGVDSRALETALKWQGGKSVIILPQGITTFGKIKGEMYQRLISGNLLLLSQFHPKAPWSVANAMMRNSLIYASAKETFVAQSDTKGGTWAGATEALRKGRSVFVRWPEDTEQTANKILAQRGAKPVDVNGSHILVSEDELLTDEEREEKEINKKLLSFLKDGAMSRSEIKRHLVCDWSESKLYKWLDKNKLICRVASPQKNRQILYTLVNDNHNSSNQLQLFNE